MKKILLITIMPAAIALLSPARANAQLETVEDIIKAAIMDVDLGVQKAQTQTIILQEAQKEAETLMEHTHLNDITDWVQQQKDLFSEYYQELWQVKDALANFQRVTELIDRQTQIVAGYRTAVALVRKDPHFSADELTHMINVYDGILSQSVDNIRLLSLAIQALVTQMSDGDRLEIIDDAAVGIDRNYSDLTQYTQENILLSMQRAKSRNDLNAIRSLYGIQEVPL